MHALTGGDQLLVDDNGNSEVSAEDYAIAIADLLEKGGRERERITVAWQPTQLAD
jgi:putative NADH-flavin reductase